MYGEWIVVVALVMALLWMKAGITFLEGRISNIEDELKANEKAFKEVGEEIDKLWDEQR